MTASASGDVVDSAAHGIPPFADASNTVVAVGEEAIAAVPTDKTGTPDTSTAEGEDAWTGDNPNADRFRPDPDPNVIPAEGDSMPAGPLPTRARKRSDGERTPTSGCN